MLAYKKNSTHPHSNQPKLSRVAPCGYAVSVVCYEKVVANTFNLITMLAFIQGSRAASYVEVCVVTEVSTFLIIIQVSSGFRKITHSHLYQM